MKTIKQTLNGLTLALLLAITETGFSQTSAPIQDSFAGITLTATPVQAEPILMNFEDVSVLRKLSDVQLAAFINVLDATPQLPCAALPRNGMLGNFFSLQHPDWPPLPMNSSQSSVWQMDGFYLMNDVNFDYDAASAVALAAGPWTRMGAMSADGIAPPDAGGGTNSYTPNDSPYTPPDYGTNLWIAQTAIASGNLTGIGTNTMADVQFEIQSRTNLLQSDWQSEGFILGSELTNWTPLSVWQSGRTNLFIRLRSWMDSDNVGIPDWWQLQYFGYVGINPYAASPAGDGYMIWQKYQSGLNPTNFETPPAPNNFVAVLSTNGTDVLLSWSPAQGAVANYSIVRGVYDSGTGNYRGLPKTRFFGFSS